MRNESVRKMHVAVVGGFQEGCGVGSFGYEVYNSFAEDRRVVGRGSAYPIVNSAGKTNYINLYGEKNGGCVKYEIVRGNIQSYLGAAEDIVSNAKRLDEDGIAMAVFMNHENGLFASPFNGGYKKDDFCSPMLDIFQRNNVPVVTTLHTVELENLDKEVGNHFDRVLESVINNSNKAICITDLIEPMMEKYDIPRGRLIAIKHWVPQAYIPETTEEIRSEYNFKKEDTIFTCFGHLSRGKGVEYVLEGFSEVVDGSYRNKNPRLFIAGGTHPNVIQNEGEAYREELMEKTLSLGLSGAVVDKSGCFSDLEKKSLSSIDGRSVVYLNRPLTDKEIPRIIYMSTCGIVGNLNERQYSSGPGSFWIGLGKPLIATASVFFKAMESSGVGLLVPFRDSKKYTESMNHILSLNQEGLDVLKFNAQDVGSTMAASIVGQQYVNLMENMIQHNLESGRRVGE
jgi:glycosyltransferase involved in cell wall biosynthesis